MTRQHRLPLVRCRFVMDVPARCVSPIRMTGAGHNSPSASRSHTHALRSESGPLNHLAMDPALFATLLLAGHMRSRTNPLKPPTPSLPYRSLLSVWTAAR